MGKDTIIRKAIQTVRIGRSSHGLWQPQRFFHSKAQTLPPRPENGSSVTWPRLPVLEQLSDMVSDDVRRAASNTAVISVQHLLHTTGSLLDTIKRMGVDVLCVSGKPYSNCQQVIANLRDSGMHHFPNGGQTAPGFFSNGFTNDIVSMWAAFSRMIKGKKHIKNIVVLDEGGYCLSLTPRSLLDKYNIVGIEQTMNGLMKPEMLALPFPIIGVASSAVKRYLESKLIADAVIEKLSGYLPAISEGRQVCGVIGYGHIGQAIAEKLVALGHKVLIFERDNSKGISHLGDNAMRLQKLSALVAGSRYIFGCTGQDVTTDLIEHFETATSPKDLISCSSADFEYLSLLRLIQNKNRLFQNHDPLSDIEYNNMMGSRILIRKGGFPINFDLSGVSVAENKIQLTRGLLLLAFFQAHKYIIDGCRVSGKHMLDPVGQSKIASIWKDLQHDSSRYERVLRNLENPEWVRHHSDGTTYPMQLFKQHQDILNNVNLTP